MTRKDFELIATILKDYKEEAPETIQALAEHFACALTYTNPSFDESRFVEAVMS